MMRNSGLSGTGLVLMALAVPGVTGICEAQEEAGTELPAVVVTASRLEEKAEDVASTTTVIRSSDMRARQQRKVLDALRDVPALDVVQTGPKGSRTSVYIRGSNSEHTLVLIDGVEVNEAISSGRTFDFAQLTDDNIDRIEVVRGPQSVLYGSDAIGGVINIITKKGRGDPRVSLRAEGGSFGTYGTSANVGAGSDRMNFTVGVSRSETDGISSADEALGNTEDDGYENTTFSTRLGVTPTEFFEMNFFARFMDSEAEIDNGSGVRDDPNNTVKRTQWHLKFEPSLRLFDGIWEQKLGVGLTEVNRENNNLQDTAHPDDLTLSNFDSRILDIDWQHNFYIHESNTLTLGAETEEDAGESFFRSESAFGPFTSVFNERKVRTWGFYGQDKITIGENFTGTAGIRVDDHEEFGTRLTYRVTSAYRFVDAGTRIRATLGTGFKSPSLFQLFSSFGDPNLRPEKSLGWDIGVDQELWDKLTVGITFFHNDFENLIEFDSGTSRFGNVVEAKSQGIEIAASMNPLDNLALQLSYTYLDTEDESTGLNLTRRAEHKVNLQSNYRFTERGAVNLNLHYVGERDNDDFSTSPSTRVVLDDYFLVNLGASYDISENLQLFGRIENLTDEEYQEVLGFGVPGIAGYFGIEARF